MWKLIKHSILEVLGLNSQIETILENQEQILEKLEKVQELQEKNTIEITEQKETSYYDYLTLKNLLLLLLLLGSIGGGYYIFTNINTSGDLLSSLKDLGNLNNDLILDNSKKIINSIGKLCTTEGELSKEQIKLLIEIKNLLLKQGLGNNPELKKLLEASRQRVELNFDEIS